MPTYGYRCQSCSSEFEIWQRMTDEARADCPSCGAQGKRLFFPAGIVFKGGGFYKTDSRGADTGGTAAATKVNGDGGATKEAGKAAANNSSDHAGAPATAPSPDAASGPRKPTPSSSAPAPSPTAAPSAPSGGSSPGKSA